MHSDPGFLARVAGATLMALLAGTAPAADLARASACKGPAPCVLAPRALWQGDAPTLKDWPGTAAHAGPDEVRDNGDVVFNVTRPSYQAFLPAPGKATGAAVLVAPGGGFIALSLRNEGTEVARWLAEHGIAAFVLRYRTFYQAPGESRDDVMKRMLPAMGSGQAGSASVADGIEALRQIRAHAAEFGIDPHRIGGVGFSAGAHVVGMMALAPDERERLDFVGLVYGLARGTTDEPATAEAFTESRGAWAGIGNEVAALTGAQTRPAKYAPPRSAGRTLDLSVRRIRWDSTITRDDLERIHAGIKEL